MKQFLLKLLLLASFSFIVIICHAQPGTLDSSFGVNGKSTTNFGNSPDKYLNPAATAIQQDGKIVIAGRLLIWNAYKSSIALVRFNSNGTPDSSFGINGKVNTYFDSADYEGVAATTVLIQPDKKILVGGYKIYPGLEWGNFILARYLPNGNLDSSFGLNGKVFTDVDPNFDPETSMEDLAIQADGKILAAGYSDGFCLIRYLPTGNIDSSFGLHGKVQDVGDFRAIYDIEALKDGKILVLDQTHDANYLNDNFEIIRLLPNGSYDSSFANNGSQIIDFYGADDWPSAVTLTNDNKILVTGAVYNNAVQLTGVVKLTYNGELDLTFGVNGKFTYPDTRRPAKILAAQDGKFFISSSNLRKFKYDGTVDSSYGLNGNAKDFIGANDAALQKDENIIVINQPDFTIARYKNDEPITVNLQRNISVTEGNSGTTPAQFKVVLNRPSAYDVQVNYTTINGNATSGSDYVAASGKAVIKAGKTSKTIPVSIIGDNVKEKNEKFALVIGNPVNAQLGINDTATCTIKNDDPGFAVSVADAVSADTKTAAMKLYPNPAKDLLRIEGLEASGKTNISITDMNGNIVLKRSLTGNNASLNIQQLAAGVYELSIASGNKMQAIKFVKE